VAHLRNGRVPEYRLRPSDFGLKEAPLEALRGGLPAENARTLIDLLSGCTGPRRDLVLINAAAALVVAGRAAGFREGVWIAAQAIDSGAARERLHALQGPEAGE
jgi:anthranilate phosphoribosyltransferase